MAMRSMVSRTPLVRLMEVTRQSPTSAIRYLSSGSGRVLDEEERAAENVYIKKMERERLEKQKLKEEKEKAEKEKSDKDPKDTLYEEVKLRAISKAIVTTCNKSIITIPTDVKKLLEKRLTKAEAI